jgi:hypothetical protein
MNERIKELMKEANKDITIGKPFWSALEEFSEKFAELIVRECVKECKQEWYDLNAESIADDDPFKDPRATGIRVGQKNGVLKCISRIKQHFGVEE